MKSTLAGPAIGDGVYTFRQAAAILGGVTHPVTTRQLRYWMSTGLTPASFEADNGEPILSFEDLISLEIVRRFRGERVSLQRVRRVEAALRKVYSYPRPFAHRVFFTDGANVWAEVGGDEMQVVEVVGSHRNQYAWRGAIRTFASDILFEGEDQHAATWHVSPWVDIDPRIQFGAPVVRGTRVPVRTIEANLTAGTPAEVASWYGLSVDQVEGARDYLAFH